MRVGSLFAGIGGFDIGLERAGMEIAWQCEIDPFCNKVLAKHWPNVKRYGDIRELNGSELEPVELICGGFPCQPYSCAGKRMGAEDDRALWPEMLRIIQEVRPRWVIGENVAGFINMGLDNSISDLEREGYAVQAFVIPACAVNAPHRRDRVWIVANRRCEHGERAEVNGELNRPLPCEKNAPLLKRPNSDDGKGINSYTSGAGYSGTTWEGSARKEGQPDGHPTECVCDVTDTSNQGLQGGEKAGNIGIDWKESRNEQFGRYTCWEEPWLEVATRLCRVDDGLPRQVDRVNRLKALGNAVVPKIPEIIGLAIMEIEKG